MKKSKMFGILLATILVLPGCATTPTTMEQIASDEAKASKIRAEAAKDAREKEQAYLEGMIKQVPAWALEVPRPDATGIYAVGMSENNVLRVALRQATLEAEYGLAKTYSQELSGSERAYTQSNGSQTGTEQYTALIDKLVSQVPVSGFEVSRQEIKPIEGKYHAYVLLKLPYSQFNQVLKEQRAKQSAVDKTVTAAFDDLAARLEKRRKERLEDERAASVTATQPIVTKAVDVAPKKVTQVDQSVSIESAE